MPADSSQSGLRSRHTGSAPRSSAGDGLHDSDESTPDDQEFLQLERMVVAPERQGQGIGSEALKIGLRETADARHLRVVLGTQEERNVVFYKRAGFQMMFE